MHKQVCIITGGNTGIGYSIAKKISELDYHVIITCRKQANGEKAVRKIRKSSPTANVEYLIGDLSSIKSTKDLGTQIKSKFPVIDIVFFNAGIWPTSKRINLDGLEEAFMVNYLSMFILYKFCAESLRSSTSGRIVIVNAGLYVNGTFSLDKTPYGKDFGRFKTYANTKLCGVMFMLKLLREADELGFIINATHPGVFRTGLGNSWGPLGLLIRFIKLFWKSAKKSYIGPVYLATSPEVTQSGKFYDVKKEIELSEESMNQVKQDELWEFSQRITEL